MCYRKYCYSYIDNNKLKFIDVLREAVAIPSVSASIERRQDVIKMVQWTEKRLNELGVETSLRELGTQSFPNGQVVPLPPAILGTLGKDPTKKTVLVYGHLGNIPSLALYCNKATLCYPPSSVVGYRYLECKIGLCQSEKQNYRLTTS